MAIDYLELWYTALHDPVGLKIQTNDADRLKQKLYQARKSADDPNLSLLTVLTSPLHQQTEVWIAHRNQEPTDG